MDLKTFLGEAWSTAKASLEPAAAQALDAALEGAQHAADAEVAEAAAALPPALQPLAAELAALADAGIAAAEDAAKAKVAAWASLKASASAT